MHATKISCTYLVKRSTLTRKRYVVNFTNSGKMGNTLTRNMTLIYNELVVLFFQMKLSLNVCEKLTTNSFTRQVVIFHKHHTSQYRSDNRGMMSFGWLKAFFREPKRIECAYITRLSRLIWKQRNCFPGPKTIYNNKGYHLSEEGVVNTGNMTPIFTQRIHDLFKIRILAAFITCSLK